ncbi:hypothetical protein AVEN_179030-1 [Araneus ventricosus]|uniref:Uncharacterized protein n=1 Tax=Araneus ventricosus TaxID=182803 RepID=A0A4Y2VHS1_ARAVE|nr:hypothetical protein AVEN_179030-1 [Araneus ventricosus]
MQWKQKSEKFKELLKEVQKERDELKQAQCEDNQALRNDLKESITEIDALRRKLTLETTRKEFILSQKETYTKLYEDIKLTLSEIQGQRDDLERKNKDLEFQLGNFEHDLTLEKSRIDLIHSKTTDFEKLHKEMKKKLLECQRERDVLKTENEGLKLEFEQKESEMQRKENDLKNQQESLKTVQETLNERCEKIQMLEENKAQFNETSHCLSNLKKDFESIKKENQKLERKNQQIPTVLHDAAKSKLKECVMNVMANFVHYLKNEFNLPDELMIPKLYEEFKTNVTFEWNPTKYIDVLDDDAFQQMDMETYIKRLMADFVNFLNEKFSDSYSDSYKSWLTKHFEIIHKTPLSITYENIAQQTNSAELKIKSLKNKLEIENEKHSEENKRLTKALHDAAKSKLKEYVMSVMANFVHYLKNKFNLTDELIIPKLYDEYKSKNKVNLEWEEQHYLDVLNDDIFAKTDMAYYIKNVITGFVSFLEDKFQGSYSDAYSLWLINNLKLINKTPLSITSENAELKFEKLKNEHERFPDENKQMVQGLIVAAQFKLEYYVMSAMSNFVDFLKKKFNFFNDYEIPNLYDKFKSKKEANLEWNMETTMNVLTENKLSMESYIKVSDWFKTVVFDEIIKNAFMT